MAAMGLGILSSGVCLLYAIIISTASAYVCLEYTETGRGNYYHRRLQCDWRYCCGRCENRYCCSDEDSSISEDDQRDCPQGSNDDLDSDFSFRPWSTIVSSIMPIVICVLLITCCFALRKCRERRSQPVVAGVVTTTTPQQLSSFPASHQPYQGSYHQGTQHPSYQHPAYQHPAYQPVPTQAGYGTQPMPLDYEGQPVPSTPPPSYGEITGPGYPHAPMPYSQAAFTPGQPVYPLQPPAQPNAPSPPQPAYPPQQAYNPSYVAPTH